MSKQPIIFGHRENESKGSEHWTDYYKQPALAPLPGEDKHLYSNLPRIQAEVDLSEQFLGRHHIKPQAWLNLACGPALHHSLQLLERYPHLNIVGVDYSPIFVEQAQTALKQYKQECQPNWVGQVDIQVGDMRALTFTPNSFEVISLYGNSFGCFDDETHVRILNQLYGLLRSPGLLLITIPNYDYATSHTIENPIRWSNDIMTIEGLTQQTGHRVYKPELGRTVSETVYVNTQTAAQVIVYYSARLYPVHSPNGPKWSWETLAKAAGFGQLEHAVIPPDGHSYGLMANMEIVGLVKE